MSLTLVFRTTQHHNSNNNTLHNIIDRCDTEMNILLTCIVYMDFKLG